MIYGPIVGIVGFFVNGFVFTKMYNYFIPTITGLNNITFWYSCGLCAVIGYLAGMHKSIINNDTEEMVEIIKQGGIEFRTHLAKVFTKAIIAPFVALFFGWWIHCYC